MEYLRRIVSILLLVLLIYGLVSATLMGVFGKKSKRHRYDSEDWF